MAGIPVKVGDPVPLSLQLESLDATKFVRAFVVDNTGTIETGSPFTLSHDSNGLYLPDSQPTMPDRVLHATYIVYDDAGFTTISEDNFPGVDTFGFIQTELRIIKDVDAELFQAGNIVAEIDDGETFDAVNPSGGVIDGSAIDGGVKQGELITGGTFEGETE